MITASSFIRDNTQIMTLITKIIQTEPVRSSCCKNGFMSNILIDIKLHITKNPTFKVGLINGKLTESNLIPESNK